MGRKGVTGFLLGREVGGGSLTVREGRGLGIF